ncbi:DUF1819 family protein [Candidatus Parcubacteria bacterium]|nr:MAG: DUF1819 family protein [Candidatus Parcubacteria bacterium]
MDATQDFIIDCRKEGVLVKDATYTTRLIKGGGLLPQMRTLVRLWHEDTDASAVIAYVEQHGLLGRVSHRRIKDVVRRVFIPRYVEGNPPQAWRFLQAFEDNAAPVSVVRPLYYFYAARAEMVMGDFVRLALYERYISGLATVRVEDALHFITEAESEGRITEPWSESVRLRVARHLLAALRDFGILEGRAHKRIAAPYLSVLSFAHMAFLLTQERRGAAVFDHPDWRLFLLRPATVEHLFVEADRHGPQLYRDQGLATLPPV